MQGIDGELYREQHQEHGCYLEKQRLVHPQPVPAPRPGEDAGASQAKYAAKSETPCASVGGKRRNHGGRLHALAAHHQQHKGEDGKPKAKGLLLGHLRKPTTDLPGHALAMSKHVPGAGDDQGACQQREPPFCLRTDAPDPKQGDAKGC
ncbi:hypothetical protein [Cupriavidus nantongensis]